MIEVKTNLYSEEDFNLIVKDAEICLLNPRKINKAGNKFADVLDQNIKNILLEPFRYLGCTHWYASYFQHKTPVYPHTDNDAENMQYVGVLPLYWDVKDNRVDTIVHNETSPEKIILTVRNTVTDLAVLVWTKNTGIIFDANLFHSSTDYVGVKTGVQIIGYR